MSEELLIRHCAPTLASIKTGSLFNCRYESQEAMLESIRCMNRRLGKKGLRFLPLHYREGLGLIYAYRPSRLCRDLSHETAHRLLGSCGYCCQNPNRCLVHLKQRLAAQAAFPHEIGLFLGYPPEDVEGFMQQKKAKCTGYWKVYGDVDTAQRTFERYKKCTRLYLEQWKKGNALEKLTVAL